MMFGFTKISGYALLAALLASSSLGAVIRRDDNPPSVNGTLPTKYLGSLSMNKPGFANVLTQDGELSLFVSSFQAFGSDSVFRLDDVSAVPQSSISGMNTSTVPGSITWPNDATAAPSDVFGSDGVVVGGGFLVPGKSNGGIYFSPSSGGSSGKWVELISQSGWFYHRAIFADMDGDGNQEMVSCRANKPLFGSTKTMLVVLKPQDPSNPVGPWVETEIGPGCDSLFTVADLNGDGIPEVIATSYFTSTLNLFYSTTKTGFAKASDVKMVTIDQNVGAAFDVQVVDINMDGKNDLLVTNHQGDGTGSVFAYEIPSNITNPKGFTRHTLASGFPITQGGLNQASPGTAIAFRPTPQQATGAPFIALAGDAAQIAYVLVPGTAPWSYDTTILHNCGCTVGKLAVADLDGDGSQEIIVPCYDNNEIVAYSFGS